jgi:hypothetical protein
MVGYLPVLHPCIAVVVYRKWTFPPDLKNFLVTVKVKEKWLDLYNHYGEFLKEMIPGKESICPYRRS